MITYWLSHRAFILFVEKSNITAIDIDIDIDMVNH